jgi:uncharacterized protein YbjT (DUF2867 family)
MATYFVSQAGGIQAQWTIKNLLDAGAKVHAVVRNPQKAPSVLQSPGVTLFQGDNNNLEALSKAAQGCQGVFLNTYPNPADLEAEGEQARTILEAAKQAGIEAVVAMTSFFTGRKESWSNPKAFEIVGGYYTAKFKVEEVVRAAGFKHYTILRPAFIHTDYLVPHVYGNYPSLPEEGVLAHAFDEGVGMLHIDERDIGRYAAAALLDPVKFDKEEIELANEYLTADESARILSKVSGRTIEARRLSPEQLEAALTRVFLPKFHLWANFTDLPSTAKATAEKFGIPFTSLEDYLTTEKERLLECLTPKHLFFIEKNKNWL